MGGWAPLAAPRSLHPLRADSPSSPIAIAAINLTGMMVRKDNCGEYRVAFRGANATSEPGAAYVDDRDEALSTAIAMAAISVAYWSKPVAPVSLA
jgi:hypothetical protein